MATDIDYDKLAAETGGEIVVDYDNLAKEHGGVVGEKPAAPQEGKGHYLSDLAQPAVDLEAKLHERGATMANAPLLAKPASYINQLAGGIGDAVTGLAETATNLIPQKAQAAIGNVLEAPAQAVSSGIGKLGRIIPSGAKQGASDIVQGAGELSKEHPILSEYAKAIPNVLTLGLPLGKGAETIGRKATGMVGEGLEKLGKTGLAGEMKITKPVAKKAYGGTLEEQKQGIIDDIVKFDLHSPTGNFKNMAEKAQSKASENFAKADEIVKEIAAKPDAPIVNPLNVAKANIAELPIAAGSEDAAALYMEKIANDFAKKGFDQDGSIENLVKAKKYLNADGQIFANGPMASDADNMQRTIRKSMYLSIVDEIAKISPEIKQLNTDGKRLLDISSAADEAAARKTNHSLVGLAGLAAGGGAYAHGGTPEAIAAALAATMATRAAGQGRLASVGINAGKLLQGASKLGLKDGSSSIIPDYETIGKKLGTALRSKKSPGLPGILGNERGSVGGDAAGKVAQQSYGFTPAIKDPLTGEIYQGALGHKYILNKYIPKDSYDATWKKLMSDNKGNYNDNIGFVDKDGNFIPRQKAEQLAEAELAKRTSPSLATQFHNSEEGSSALPTLAATGAVSGAALTAGLLAKKRLDEQKAKRK